MGTNVLPAKKSFVHSHRVPLHMKRMTWHHQFIFAKTAKRMRSLLVQVWKKQTMFHFHITSWMSWVECNNIVCTCRFYQQMIRSSCVIVKTNSTRETVRVGSKIMLGLLIIIKYYIARCLITVIIIFFRLWLRATSLRWLSYYSYSEFSQHKSCHCS